MGASDILIVEDDVAAAKYLAMVLEEEDYRTRTACDGLQAVLEIERQLPLLVVSDVHMPRMDGLDLLQMIKQRWSGLPVVLTTVDEEVPRVVWALQNGASDYLIKPVSPAALLHCVRRILESPRREMAEDHALAEIVGHSPAIVEVRHMVSIAARSDVNVLLVGETGSGKDVVARAIHRHSARSEAPFVAHNCAASPRDLFESQFFGHRKGAFTGADRDCAGLLSRADRGVLFLDELEALAAENQAKLLRVIEDGEILPLGASSSQKVSLRCIAAMNRDPQFMLADGLLREDLYYRLCGFAIRLPPLRDRADDIELLATHFLAQWGGTMTTAAARKLTRHDWPGNVRQLKNALRLALAISPDGRIEAENLHLEQGQPIRRPAAESRDCLPKAGLKDLEKEAISAALRKARGNRSAAARALGIHRSTLHRKISRMGLDPGGSS